MLIFENIWVLIPLAPLALISALFASGLLTGFAVRRMDLPEDERRERTPRVRAALRLLGVVGLFTALCAAAFLELNWRGMSGAAYGVIIGGFVAASVFFVVMMKRLPRL